MNTHADKTQKNRSQSVAIAVSQKKSSSESTFQFVDNRPEAISQRKLQEIANNSPKVWQLRGSLTNSNLNEGQNQISGSNVIQLVLSLKDMAGGGQTTDGSYKSVKSDCEAFHQNPPAVNGMTFEQLKAEKSDLTSAISILKISTKARNLRLVTSPKNKDDKDHKSRYDMEVTQLGLIEARLKAVDAERVKKIPAKTKPKKDKEGFITVTGKK